MVDITLVFPSMDGRGNSTQTSKVSIWHDLLPLPVLLSFVASAGDRELPRASLNDIEHAGSRIIGHRQEIVEHD